MKKKIVGLALVLAIGFIGAAQSQDLFQPPIQVTLPLQTFGVAVGDINGDGLKDVVTNGCCFVPGPIPQMYMFLGRPDGSLNPAPVTFQQQSLTGSLNLADVTGDGRDDIVGSGLNGLEVIAQNAAGGLAPSLFYPSQFSGQSRVGDLNGDGRIDVIGLEDSFDGHTNTEEAAVWFQNPAGSFDAQQLVQLPHGTADDIEATDINGDGRTDVVVVNAYNEPSIVILYQSVNGGLSTPYGLSIGPGLVAQQVGVGDLDGDGRKDLAVTYGGYVTDVHLAVFHQNADGTFAAPTLTNLADWLTAIEVADANGDGRKDILLLHQSSLGMILQNANGTLAAETFIALPPAGGHYLLGFVASDINGDGAIDVAYSQVGAQGALTVLYGIPRPPPVNQPPVAVPDRVTLRCDDSIVISVLANDSDPEGGPFAIVLVSKPAHGTAHATSDGKRVKYVPKRGFRGTDRFTYTISDGIGGTATATVTVTVK